MPSLRRLGLRGHARAREGAIGIRASEGEVIPLGWTPEDRAVIPRGAVQPHFPKGHGRTFSRAGLAD
jgi:hypothetical protein